MDGDPRFMEEALAEAARGAGRTHPNPAVGAVIVREGRIAGRGFHAGPGSPHAEVVAIREARGEALGSDLYVTLEPCCTHGRTPPCTDAIREAGIARVFAACIDPKPRVNGGGFAALRKAGIRAELGLLSGRGLEVDSPYQIFYRKGRPFVHLKWAQSLDGRAQRPGGGYLTGLEARRRVHRDRFLSDAILATASSVIEDGALLTVREGSGPKALLRVILDRRARIRGTEKVFSTCPEEGAIWVLRPQGAEETPGLGRQGVLLKQVSPHPASGLSLGEILGLLASEKVMALYAEAVGRLSWAFLSQGLVDRLSVDIAPILVGGSSTVPALGGEGFPGERLPDLRGASWERMGDDWVVTKDFPDARSLLEVS